MKSLFYPRATLRKMINLGLSESVIADVFNNGEEIKGKNGMVKKYSSYEVGLFYVVDDITEEYKITAVWKKQRR